MLDNALALLQRSELYDSTFAYNIIICDGSFYNKIDDKLFGEGRTSRSIPKNIIVKVPIDPGNNLAFATFHKACDVNLTELLTHEMIHCLQANKYGLLKFNPFHHPEFWKLEGYPEYISQQQEFLSYGYSLTGDIDRYLDLKHKATDIWISSKEGGCEVPDFYYKGKLMMEYLMDIKHMSYDEVLKDSAAEDVIFQQIVQWNNDVKRSKK